MKIRFKPTIKCCYSFTTLDRVFEYAKIFTLETNKTLQKMCCGLPCQDMYSHYRVTALISYNSFDKEFNN